MTKSESAPAICPPGARPDEMRARIVEALKGVFDPEIPVNVHDLGLIYGIEVGPSGGVVVTMTLTSPNCPVAQSLPEDVKRAAESVPGVAAAYVEVVWDPPWDPYKMSEAAKLTLNML